MVTKFKIFEKLNELPKIGDYVLLDINNYTSSPKIWQDFIKNNIGEIVEIDTEHGGLSFIYKVKFENIPENVKDTFFIHYDYINSFLYWSSDKNELEMILNTKKYNL